MGKLNFESNQLRTKSASHIGNGLQFRSKSVQETNRGTLASCLIKGRYDVADEAKCA